MVRLLLKIPFERSAKFYQWGLFQVALADPPAGLSICWCWYLFSVGFCGGMKIPFTATDNSESTAQCSVACHRNVGP